MPRRLDLEADLDPGPRGTSPVFYEWPGEDPAWVYRLGISHRMLVLSSRPHGGSNDRGWYRDLPLQNTQIRVYRRWFGFGSWELLIRSDHRGERFRQSISLDEDEVEALQGHLAAAGFLEGAASPPPTAPATVSTPHTEEAWNPELFTALVEDPCPETAAVLGDWLQAEGDPRGTLIQLQLSGEDPAAFLEANRVQFYGVEWPVVLRSDDTGLAVPHRSYDELGSLIARWRLGFLDGLALPLGHEGMSPAAAHTVLAHPSSRLLRELVIQAAMFEDRLDLPPIPTLRSLRIGDFHYPEECEMSWSQLGAWDLSSLPGLTHLHLQGAVESVVLPPGLLEVVLESSTTSSKLVQGLVANTPRATRITIWTGSEEYGSTVQFEDVAPLLERRLDHLGLMNSEFTDALIVPLAQSRVLPHLKSLDLSLGTLSDDGVRRLLEHSTAFEHLESLNLDENHAVGHEDALRERFGARVSVENQREGDQWRYVSVSE